MILIYAFSNRWATNISRRVLSELEKIIVGATLADAQINFIPINNYPQNFYKKYIEGSRLPCQGEVAEGRRGFTLIIGLGDGSKLVDKIKIETQAKNSYNNQSISPFSPILLDLNLPNVDNYDPRYFKISDNMGTYNCNWLAYKTQLYINNYSPDTYHLFLHLPQHQNATLLAQSIAQLISDNNLLSYS